MTDLRARLEAGLAGTYRIERELGGGGMSRVFVAEEIALGRRIVLKVLPPDFSAGISADRFRREIKVAAGLQHPNIVPLHAAGETRELLYYTMPFVEGETLGARIERTGRFAPAEARAILREIADALAHAHRRGVVHRDVKPANILLSGEHALVTDFGVAKAVAEATGEAPLTSAGLAIGTPAYMAPEQVAADPAADERVDVYAFGAVAFEALSGRPPFGYLPPHAALAAHVSRPPPEISALAPDVPPALGQLVMRCLAKDPDARPRNGQELVTELDTAFAATNAAGSRPAAKRLLIGVLAVAAVVALATWSLRPRAAASPLDRNLVAVFPFRVAGAPEQFGEGIVDLLAARLTGEGGPRAVDPQSAISAWQRAPTRNAADASRIATRLGSARAVVGSIVGIGAARISVTAQLIDAKSGRTLAPESVDGSVDSLAWLVDRLAVRLLARSSSESEARLPDLTTRSPDALRAYLAGQSAYRRGAYAEALTLHERAIDQDSSFALAALAAAGAAHWISEDARRDAAFQVASANQARLSPHDRLFMRLRGALYGFPIPFPWRRWLALADSATALTPDRAEAWFELGDAYFHEGRALGIPDARARARVAFARSAALDSGFAAPLEHLIELAAVAGDSTEVRRLSNLYFAVDSVGDLADFMRWRVAAAVEDSAAREAIRRRMDQMTTSTLLRIAGTAQLDGVALEDVSPALDAVNRRTSGTNRALLFLAAATAANRGQPARFDSLLRAARGAMPPARIASVRAGAGAFWIPDSAMARAGGNELLALVGDPSLRVSPKGRTEGLCGLGELGFARQDSTWLNRFRDELEQMGSTERDSSVAAEARICVDKLAAAVAVLHEPARSAEATARFGAAINDMPPTSPVDHLFLALMHERRGDARASLAAAQRREHHWIGGLFFLTAYLLQEARMARIAGEDTTAIRAYQHYLRLRAEPEPAVRPHVDQVRRDLAEILGEPRRR